MLVNISVVYFKRKSWKRVNAFKVVQNSIISKGSNMLFFISGDRRMLNGSSAVASKQKTRFALELSI